MVRVMEPPEMRQQLSALSGEPSGWRRGFETCDSWISLLRARDHALRATRHAYSIKTYSIGVLETCDTRSIRFPNSAARRCIPQRHRKDANELLCKICGACGVRPMMPSVVAAQRADPGWHHAITGLSYVCLDHEDVALVARCTSLAALRLGNACDAPIDAAAVLQAVAPALRRLVGVVGCGSCLRAFAGDCGLRTRLRKLVLLMDRGAQQPLGDPELAALASLSSLRRLTLNCSAVRCSPAALRSACGALARLEELQLVASSAAEEDLASSTAAAALLPGGLHGLSALGLFHIHTGQQPDRLC
jgi:hypothetical protein